MDSSIKMKFQVGDIVRLNSGEGRRYSFQSGGTIGTIIAIEDGILSQGYEDIWFRVNWENRMDNVYHPRHLEHARIRANNISRRLNPDKIEKDGYLYDSIN